MSDIFLRILNMSINAGWLIIAVIILRLILKKVPKWVNCTFWMLAGLRLVIPFSPRSVLSLIPSAETVQPDIVYSAKPAIESGISSVNRLINPMISQSFTPDPSASVNPLQVTVFLLSMIWIAGAAVMLLYLIVSALRLKSKVRTAVRLRENIYQSENAPGPFVFGIIRPKIYLPFDLEEKSGHIIAHEQAHIKRGDHLWKPLGFLILSVYWFNPLIWIAYILLCRDIELACDEYVIRSLDDSGRADYSQALLSCSTSRRIITACPLAFGETGIKERVRSVIKYKKPVLLLIIASVLVCAVLAVCFLTNPAHSADRLTFLSQDTTSDNATVKFKTELGKDVLSARVFAEYWDHGNCTSSPNVKLRPDCEELDISIHIDHDEGQMYGTTVEITAENGGARSSLTENEDFGAEPPRGWSVTSYSEGERINMKAGEDVILAAMIFGYGEGIHAYGCKTLMSKPEYLSDAEYMIVIRAQFYEEETEYDAASDDYEAETYNKLSCKSVIAAAIHTGIDYALYYPVPDKKEEASICIADNVDTDGFVEFLKNANWKECILKREKPNSPGSVEFVIEDDYRVTVYKKPKIAIVSYGGEKKFYRIGSKDFNTVLEFLHSSDDAETYEWLDYYMSEDMPWSGRRERYNSNFSDTTFVWYPEKVEAIIGTQIVPLYSGMPIWSVYFSDITGDGMPELCSTVSIGSGMVDTRIIVYDYVNKTEYLLEDRGEYDYYLTMTDGILIANKCEFRTENNGPIISSGELYIENGELKMPQYSSVSTVGGADGPASVSEEVTRKD